MTLDGPLLDAIPLWALFCAAIVVIVVAHESGFRTGRARSAGIARQDKENESSVGGMVAAQLGLFALLLAFTFGLAASHHDSRRQIVLEEANAIGTSWLRAELLPASHEQELSRLLREYVDVRVVVSADPEAIVEAIRRSEDVQSRLWAEGIAATDEGLAPPLAGMVLSSLNHVFDLHARRVAAGVWTRIPGAVFGALFVVAVLSFAAIGYHGGFTGAKRSPALLVVAVTFSAVLWLIVDLDRPSSGLIRTSQQPLVDLQASMSRQADVAE